MVFFGGEGEGGIVLNPFVCIILGNIYGLLLLNINPSSFANDIVFNRMTFHLTSLFLQHYKHTHTFHTPAKYHVQNSAYQTI